jgi:hypothetical protein
MTWAPPFYLLRTKITWNKVSCLKQGSATFPLPRTTLAIHIFVEGRRKKLIMPWTVSETVFP